MIEKYNGRRIEIIDSIDALSVDRFFTFNKYVLLSAALALGLDELDDHLVDTIRYVDKSPQKAVDNINNIRSSIHLMINKVDTDMLALSALIKSVDGVPRDDMSEAGLQETLDLIKEVKYSVLKDLVKGLKKKIYEALEGTFPDFFGNSHKKTETRILMKRMNLLILDQIIEDRDYSKKILDLEKKLIESVNIKDVHTISQESDKWASEMKLVLSREINYNSSSLTVIDFFNSYELILKEQKERKKNKDNGR